MNFVAHGVIALLSGADPETAFWSMTPDFGLRAPEKSPNSGGIRLHKTLDSLFHQHRVFLHWQQLLRPDHQPSSHAHGAFRHVAVELLIDGVFLTSPTTAALYESLLPVGLVTPGPVAEFVRGLIQDDPTFHYRSPELAAARARDIVNSRLRSVIQPEPYEACLRLAARTIALELSDLTDELVSSLRTQLPRPASN
jgi:hypothetical protein